jgi:uncharacterized protein YkuJ
LTIQFGKCWEKDLPRESRFSLNTPDEVVHQVKYFDRNQLFEAMLEQVVLNQPIQPWRSASQKAASQKNSKDYEKKTCQHQQIDHCQHNVFANYPMAELADSIQYDLFQHGFKELITIEILDLVNDFIRCIEGKP